MPLRLEVKTKAERGYALLEGEGLKVEKAAEIDIPPKMPAGEAFRAIARNCLRQIIANEPVMCAGRAEGLHQMRIGLRRLRAAIAIFADVVGDEDEKKIKSELKWITQELGPARDLDVFAADVLEPLRASHPSDAGLTLTQRNFEAKRKEAYAAPPAPSAPTASAPPCSTLSHGSRRATGARPAASTARRGGRGLSPSMPRRNCQSFASASSARAPTFAT